MAAETLLIILLVFAFVVIGFLIGRYVTERKIKEFRKDAVIKSRSSVMGKVWEHIAPYLPKFKYHPADMRFIGAPIDYIVFEGMNEKEIKSIIFLEIKSGSSSLNIQEKKLKEVIENKKVRWEEFKIDVKEKK